jgi:hypothetical protein
LIVNLSYLIYFLTASSCYLKQRHLAFTRPFEGGE